MSYLKPYNIDLKTGLVFIFDNRQDDLKDEDKFEANDCKRLRTLFEENKCRVIFRTTSAFSDMKNLIKNECKTKPAISFLIVFVLTMRGISCKSEKGENYTKLYSNDKDYDLDELTSYVLDLEPIKLKGVPKLFFVEAGKSHVQFDIQAYLPNGTPISLPRTSDHLVNFIQYNNVVDEDSPFLELLIQEMLSEKKVPIQNQLIKIRNTLGDGIQMTDSSTLLQQFKWPKMTEIQENELN